jgi:hypothetical protein
MEFFSSKPWRNIKRFIVRQCYRKSLKIFMLSKVTSFSQTFTLSDPEADDKILNLKEAINNAKKIYVLSGAGISVSAGIPVRTYF